MFCTVIILFFLTVYVFGSCFRMLANILVSDFFNKTNHVNSILYSFLFFPLLLFFSHILDWKTTGLLHNGPTDLPALSGPLWTLYTSPRQRFEPSLIPRPNGQAGQHHLIRSSRQHSGRPPPKGHHSYCITGQIEKECVENSCPQSEEDQGQSWTSVFRATQAAHGDECFWQADGQQKEIMMKTEEDKYHSVCACMRAGGRACVRVSVHVSVRVLCVCVRACVHACVRACMCMWCDVICACMHVHACMQACVWCDVCVCVMCACLCLCVWGGGGAAAIGGIIGRQFFIHIMYQYFYVMRLSSFLYIWLLLIHIIFVV